MEVVLPVVRRLYDEIVESESVFNMLAMMIYVLKSQVSVPDTRLPSVTQWTRDSVLDGPGPRLDTPTGRSFTSNLVLNSVRTRLLSSVRLVCGRR